VSPIRNQNKIEIEEHIPFDEMFKEEDMIDIE
jgi:hypothetical protein